MSVGGTVISTVIAGERVWIDTREKESSSTCAIYVENTPASRVVGEGDTVWWQGEWAYWTPKDQQGKTLHHLVVDVKLKRVGLSGVSRPEPKPCDHFEASDYENTVCQRCWFLDSQHPTSPHFNPKTSNL